MIISMPQLKKNIFSSSKLGFTDIMKEGSFTHVPWMVGITDDEGAFKVEYTWLQNCNDGNIHFSAIFHCKIQNFNYCDTNSG